MRTERRDTALLATVASKLRWRYRYSLCDCLTKPDVASPVLDETVSKVLQGCMEELFFFFFLQLPFWNSLLSCHSPSVQWRNPLCMECTTCLVCPCLHYSLNLIHDKFEPFALALPFCLWFIFLFSFILSVPSQLHMHLCTSCPVKQSTPHRQPALACSIVLI